MIIWRWQGKQDESVKIEAVIQQYKHTLAAGRTGAGIQLCWQRALQSRLYRRESRTKECLPQTLSSSCTIFSHAARRPRRAVMWCQCLGPSGTVPSGAKPPRPCCHISPPIISSRSAFSFRTHFPLPCFSLRPALSLLLSAIGPSPLHTDSFFPFNLLPQQSTIFATSCCFSVAPAVLKERFPN